MTYRFPASSQTTLSVRIARGDVSVIAEDDADEAVIEVSGPQADQTTVQQDGHAISVVGPRVDGGGLLDLVRRGSDPLTVVARVPRHSDLAVKLGSADLRTTGALGHVEAAIGSGDLTVAEATGLETSQGSGDATVGRVLGSARLRTASGDARIDLVDGDAELSTASGDARVRHVTGTLQAKGASGDLTVDRADADVSARTASGDVRLGEVSRGRVDVTSASGDVEVGVRGGVPTWTDISSVSRGGVRSDLEPLGPPQDGQPYVELRVRTVSGSVALRHLPRTEDPPVAG